MRKEINAREANRTWYVEDLPAGKRPTDSKWVCKVKHKAGGSVEKYKAQLVTKIFTQVEGLDFLETLAPAVKLGSVHVFLAIMLAKR